MVVFKKILVPTDFSEASAAALAYGRDLARNYSAALHVLHVADDLKWRYSLDMTPELVLGVQEDVVATARQQLEAVLTDEDQQQLGVQAVVLTSSTTAATIVEYARDARIDLIVMGTHGRGAVSHLIMGSVAERVVRTAPCPVLTVRHPEREFVVPDALVAVASA